MKPILTILSLFLSIYLYAQGNVQVSGKLTDKATQTPLEFATVSLISNDPNVSPQGGVTDLDGIYSFTVSPGTYTVKWEFISFKPITRNNVSITENTDFGMLALEQDVAQLDAAIVVAEKTTVDLRLDKKIYNIGKDLTVRGGTVSDVLDNVPSVSVDVEGNVSLRGNSSVRILIDGRPSALVGFNGAEALRQIPSEAIERVEVITSPSARYDAEGSAGILNIILRKNRIQGFNGSINLNAGYPEQYGASANLNYRTTKWNLFTNTGYRYRTSPGNAFTDIEYLFPNRAQDPIQPSDLLAVNERRNFDRLGRSYFTSFGAEYFINDNSSIVGNVVYRLGNDDDVTTNNNERFFSDPSLNEINLREENESEDENDLQFSLDYQSDLDDDGQKLVATAQFSTSIEDKSSNILQTELISNTINDLERLVESEDETEALIQVDWEKPVGENIQYEAGYRGNYRDITNSFFFEEREVFPNGPLVPDATLNNTFSYEEFVNAVYGQYGQEFGKFSLLAGLRFEQTNIAISQETTDVTSKKDYSSLFPTLNLNYEIKDGENLTLGYNRRVRRPRGRSLNPFASRSSQNSFYQGNVDLNATFSNQVDLGYLKRWEKLTLSTSVYYNRSTDNVETIETARLVDGNQAVFRFPVNLSTEERLGYELTLTYRPFEWWTINSDANVFRVETDGDYVDPNGELDDLNFDFVNTTYFLRLNQKFSLPAKIDFQARMNYRGASENAQGSQDGIATVNLAASKDILKDQGSITVGVSDLFNARRRQSRTVTPAFVSNSAFQWRERQVNVAFVYTFNQRKKENQERGGDDDDYEFEG